MTLTVLVLGPYFIVRTAVYRQVTVQGLDSRSTVITIHTGMAVGGSAFGITVVPGRLTGVAEKVAVAGSLVIIWKVTAMARVLARHRIFIVQIKRTGMATSGFIFHTIDVVVTRRTAGAYYGRPHQVCVEWGNYPQVIHYSRHVSGTSRTTA
jgi:hypothetical protein